MARMTAPHIRGGDPRSAYGYGLAIVPDYRGVKVVQHGGGSKGISRPRLRWRPPFGFTGAALANLAEESVPTARYWPRSMASSVSPSRRGWPNMPTRRSHPNQARRYVGTYRGGEGQAISVASADGALVWTIAGKHPPARFVGDHAFVLATPTADLRAFTTSCATINPLGLSPSAAA